MKINLKKYDNKLVRIKCNDGKIYEGNCIYNSSDYTFHEFGRDEESLEIFHFLFYKDNIEKIDIIDNFTELFGEIEIETANDIDLLEQALDFDEDDRHVYRILCYLNTIEINDEIKGLLEKLIKYNQDKKIINKANELINKKNKR